MGVIKSGNASFTVSTSKYWVAMPDVLDYGDLPPGMRHTYTFYVKNTGKRKMKLKVYMRNPNWQTSDLNLDIRVDDSFGNTPLRTKRTRKVIVGLTTLRLLPKTPDGRFTLTPEFNGTLV